MRTIAFPVLAVLATLAGCVGRQWPPPPPRPVIQPGEYILSGTVRDQPFAAHLTLSPDEYALRQQDALCRGRSAELTGRSGTPGWLSCRDIRYVVRFEDGRPSAVVAYARGSVCIRRDWSGACIRRGAAGEAEFALNIDGVPASASMRDVLVPVDVLERARSGRWYVRAFGADGALVAEGVMSMTADEFTISGRRLADHSLSRLERRVVSHRRVWAGAVLGGAVLGAVGTQFTQGGDAAAKTQDAALVSAFVVGGAAAGGLLVHLARPARPEWQVVWQR